MVGKGPWRLHSSINRSLKFISTDVSAFKRSRALPSTLSLSLHIQLYFPIPAFFLNKENNAMVRPPIAISASHFLNASTDSNAHEAPPLKKARQTSKQSEQPEMEGTPQHMLEGMARDASMKNANSPPPMVPGLEAIENSERKAEAWVEKTRVDACLLLDKDCNRINCEVRLFHL